MIYIISEPLSQVLLQARSSGFVVRFPKSAIYRCRIDDKINQLQHTHIELESTSKHISYVNGLCSNPWTHPALSHTLIRPALLSRSWPISVLCPHTAEHPYVGLTRFYHQKIALEELFRNALPGCHRLLVGLELSASEVGLIKASPL